VVKSQQIPALFLPKVPVKKQSNPVKVYENDDKKTAALLH
jgi:hypothetical protein